MSKEFEYLFLQIKYANEKMLNITVLGQWKSKPQWDAS